MLLATCQMPTPTHLCLFDLVSPRQFHDLESVPAPDLVTPSSLSWGSCEDKTTRRGPCCPREAQRWVLDLPWPVKPVYSDNDGWQNLIKTFFFFFKSLTLFFSFCCCWNSFFVVSVCHRLALFSVTFKKVTLLQAPTGQLFLLTQVQRQCTPTGLHKTKDSNIELHWGCTFEL